MPASLKAVKIFSRNIRVAMEQWVEFRELGFKVEGQPSGSENDA